MSRLSPTDVYDELYARRDPGEEVDRVRRLFADRGRDVRRLLDVGCGTGRHAAAWCRNGVQVTGVDTDAAAIAQARKRAPDLSPVPDYRLGTVCDLPLHRFDAATALFHVVNYIPDTAALVTTLRAIRARLVDGAPFAFDAWNGVAALLDPPRVKDDDAVGRNGRRISVRTTPAFDRMAQTVTLSVHGTVTEPDGSTGTFESVYEHRLWTPRELVDACVFSGFATPSIQPADGSAGPADETCWKILFVTSARAEP